MHPEICQYKEGGVHSSIFSRKPGQTGDCFFQNPHQPSASQGPRAALSPGQAGEAGVL